MMGTAASKARERFTSNQLCIIGVCSLVYFLDGLLHTIMGPMAPSIARDLSLEVSELGPIFSANLIGQCLGLVTFPQLVGRIEQRTLVTLAVAGFGLVQGASAFAQDAQQLFALRLVTGFFLGGCLPICLAIVVDVAPAGRRGLASMMLFTGYGAGATLAGVVAAVFSEPGGWRIALGVIAASCIGATLAAWFGLAELDSPPARAENAGTGGPRLRRGILAPGLVLGTLMLWVLFVAMLIIQYCLSSWLPTLLVEVGRTPEFAALSVTVFSLGGIIAALGIGVLMDRIGTFRVLMASLATATVLLAVTGQLLSSASDTLLMTLLGTGGFFFLGAYGGINVVLAEFYPAPLRAVGIGWAKTVSRLGTVVAPIVIGIGLAAEVPETLMMTLFAVPCALAGIALTAIRGTQRGRAAVQKEIPSGLSAN
ncbi:MFS transporter [Croceibacterium sp. LX-88]|uniref:MFS transporter n=1 Tax=Croceibacterium selenioxidans TaxID=2838833 RepID=A0ABS5W5B5_9SPHN|nr:MFS transporter [Croceibacterium selenioxidans]MBT2134686.1 MFS transporter [Croceibacterium selenioxidans]